MRGRTAEGSTDRADRTSAAKAGSDRPAVATDPARRLQQHAGNQALQRLARTRQTAREDGETPSEDATSDDSRVSDAPDGSVGRPLTGDPRRAMERAFGRRFDGVRLHDGIQARARNRAIDADAYATASNVVLRPDHETVTTGPGRLLLAHELAHVAQFREGETADRSGAGERPTAGDAEHEARTAAVDAVTGSGARVSQSPSGPVAASVRPWWKRQVEGTIENVKSVGSTLSSTASSVGSGVDSAREFTKGMGRGVKDQYQEHDALGMIYEGMKTNASLLDQGGNYLEGKVDDLQDAGAKKMRNYIGTEGTIGQFGAELFDQVTQVPAGLGQFGITTGKNILKMGANPVDTVLGIEHMAAQAPMNGLNPIRHGRKLRQGLWQGQSWARIGKEMFDREHRRKERARFGREMLEAFAKPYRRSVGEDGDYMQGISRGAAELLTFWRAGATKASKFSHMSKTSKVTKASKGTKPARTGPPLPKSKGPSTLPKSKGSSSLPQSKGSASLPQSKHPPNLPRSKGSSALPQGKRSSSLPTRKRSSQGGGSDAGGQSRKQKIQRLKHRARKRRQRSEPSGRVEQLRKRKEQIQTLRERAKQRSPAPKPDTSRKALPGRSSEMKALPGKSRASTPDSGGSTTKALPGRSSQPKALPGRSSQPKALPGRSSRSPGAPSSRQSTPRSPGSTTGARAATAGRGSQAAQSTRVDPAGLVKKTGKALIQRHLNSDLVSDPESEGAGQDGGGGSWLDWLRSLFGGE